MTEFGDQREKQLNIKDNIVLDKKSYDILMQTGGLGLIYPKGTKDLKAGDNVAFNIGQRQKVYATVKSLNPDRFHSVYPDNDMFWFELLGD